MKCSILSKFFGTCLLAAMTINFCYAEESKNLSENFFEQGIDAAFSSDSSSDSNSRDNDRRDGRPAYISKCEVAAVDLIQLYAIYIKAGVESVAKGTVGDEFFNITAAIERVTFGINILFTHCDATAECSRNSINVLLNRYSTIIFAYTDALVNDDITAQNAALADLANISARIRRQLPDYISSKSDLAKVNTLLTNYTQATLALAQNFVTAVTTVLPPGGIANFTPAYDSYVLTLNLSRRIGRVMGASVCGSCNPRPHHCQR